MSQVDVIVPCYNYGHFLRGCVESVLAQQGVNVRVLIIDDASPDHTAEVGAALAAQDGRVEFRRHATNRGHIDTYNEGLEWTDGDYALLLSADDQLISGALLRAARLMDVHTEVGFTYGEQIKTSNPEAEDYQVPREYGWTILTGPEFLELCCTGDSYGENIVGTPTAVVRTSLQKKLGGYRKDLPHAGDMEMWMRFAVHASVGKVEAVQAYKRCHDNNMQKFYSCIKDFLQRKAAFDVLFEAYSKRIEDGQRLRRLASRCLAEGAFWMGSAAFDRGEEETCRRLLDLALEIDPTLRHWPAWYRLRLKRALGPAVWGLMRPLVRRLRHRPRSVPN
jgi:hypothetical protein